MADVAQAGGRVSAKGRDDTWVHTVCDNCYSYCGVVVHRVDGVAVKIEGDPDCPHNLGKLCAKGQAGLMGLYDPHRLKTPMKRTNPEKGVGVDPGWVPISWDEAMDTVVAKLTAVRQDDPRKFVLSTFDVAAKHSLGISWASAFGTPNHDWVGYFCGNYLHSSMYLTNGTFHSDFDIEHCNYVILLGNQHGFMAGVNPNTSTQKMAEARLRGLRVVAVDPVCSHAASKADEWVPIRPGTDGALMLAMINVLLNEAGIYDAEFLKSFTNGPYLVGLDGLYVRDGAGKPQVWDTAAGGACAFDAPAADAALDGEYTVGGVPCRPAFALLREHVRPFTPEWAEPITTVPAAVSRRLAQEFGREARIGSTITVGGKTMAHRPVAVNIYRGAGAHTHGVHVALLVQLLNIVVGSMYRPGGHRGLNVVGPQSSYLPGKEDGLVSPPESIGHGANYYHWAVQQPQTLGIYELFPISTNRSPMYQIATADPDLFNLPYKPEVLMVCRRNHFLSNVNHEQTAQALKNFNYIIFFGTHLDEVSELADIALPDAHYLEKLELFPNSLFLNIAVSTGFTYWGVRQPVVAPPPGVRLWTDVLLEIAQRMGFAGDMYRLLNGALHLHEPYRLESDRTYSREEIFDHWARSQHGPEKGLDWFKEHGYHRIPRTVDETYPLDLMGVRFPLYFENIQRAGVDVQRVTRELGLDWWDTSDYVALPVWKPCPAFRQHTDDGLYAVNYRIPIHYNSVTAQNPWLQELAQLNPYAQKILLHTSAAQRCGIADGDIIEVASEIGRVQGEVRVTELVHPEVVGISGHFGSYAKGKPIACGQGVNFNNLLRLDMKHIDWLSSGADSCVRVKVRKVSGAVRKR